jgi:hypothetical protein
MIRYLEGVTDKKNATSIRHAFETAIDRLSSQALTSAGLLVSSTNTVAKIGSSDFYATVGGVLVKIAASTDMPALTGITIGAGKYNVVCFYVDSAGTVTAAPGAQGAAIGNVVFPSPPKNKALVGFILVTYSSTFTGGSTPLSTATTLYFSPVGAFDATALTG